MTKPNKTIAEKLLALLERGRSVTSAEAMNRWGTPRYPTGIAKINHEY